jgi:hypothetical protein
VKFDVPAAVGIPDMKPAEFIFNPDGKEPAITLKLTGACPPVMLNWYVYASLIVPVDKVGGEIIFRGGHGCGLIVRVSACWVVCAPPAQLSVACTVKPNVPVVVGVPAINPDGLRFNPDGNEPPAILNVVGGCPPDVFN